MNKEELLKNAVYIQYPNRQGTAYKEYNIPEIVRLPLAKKEETYQGWVSNDNHFTTEYHRKYSLPLLNKLLNFGYDEDEFIIKERFSRQFNISIPVPKNEQLYEIWNLSTPEHLDNLSYDDITHGPHTKEAPTDYHRLYRYPHESSRLINKALKNDRRLFISDDSQMIPDMGVLSYYFKEIWYMDNRKKLHLNDKWSDINFTDVLIELNDNDASQYLTNGFL